LWCPNLEIDSHHLWSRRQSAIILI
jgi:hypothetical protein